VLALPRRRARRHDREDARAAPPAAPAAAARESVVAPDFRAAYLNNPPPAYPRIARRNGEQGTVMLRVHVNLDGVLQVERSNPAGRTRLIRRRSNREELAFLARTTRR
jgi:outer membrane biosynthesis protein TonB